MGKQAIRVLLLTALALLTVCVSALAADITCELQPGTAGVTLEPNGNNQVKVQYTGAQSGSEYLVMVQSSDGAPTEANLVYINQETAAENKVEFTVYPKTLVKGTTYHIYLSSNASTGIQAREKIGTFLYNPPYMLGDVDNDERISSRDAQLTLQIAAQSRTPTELQKIVAEVDGRDGITSRDAQYILQAAAQLRSLS